MRQQLLWEDPGASAVPGYLLEVLSHTNCPSSVFALFALPWFLLCPGGSRGGWVPSHYAADR